MNDLYASKFIWIKVILLTFILGSQWSCSVSYLDPDLTPSTMKTTFEKNENHSASYDETIQYYKELASKSDKVHIIEGGPTDSGYPLHEIIISSSPVINRKQANEQDKAVVLINNAIHPGEPCGIDASMMLARDLVSKDEMKAILKEIVVVIVPIYNISGALNRGSHSRANQKGPAGYGFRGNVRNYDLNRDFIKCDTKNAQTFNRLFNRWDPDVMVDNHTSNGADYQYVMTLIATQKDKLHPALKSQLTGQMLPALYSSMSEIGYEMTPYVNVRNTPDEGIYGFLDLPRYSSGYAALHHTYSFMPETHMLKPYKDRVWSTYHLNHQMLVYVSKNKSEVIGSRTKAKEKAKFQKKYAIQWALDPKIEDKLSFNGYEAKYKKSQVTGLDRLYYDHDAPFTKQIPFFNTYRESLTVNAPRAYWIPQAYQDVIERLEWNNVNIERIKKDTVVEVEVYYITDLESTRNAYEGHYLHSQVEVETKTVKLKYRAGDVRVLVNQESNRYIVETLEPQAADSFFAWNFMDAILMQKEYFSSYVFEDLAENLLSENPQLAKEFEEKKKEDLEFAKNSRAMLRFIYERSPYYEPTYRRYPIGREL